MMVSLSFLYWKAMDGHSKREGIEIYQYEWEHDTAWLLFFNPAPVSSILRFLEKWSYDISRDLLTQYLYFEMLTTISSFVYQILIPAP